MQSLPRQRPLAHQAGLSQFPSQASEPWRDLRRDEDVRVASGFFPFAPRPTAGDAAASRWRAVHSRAQAKKTAQLSLAQALLWPRFTRRKDKDLARMNQVGIADLLPVRLVNDGVARARAVGEAADAPEAVAAGDRRWWSRSSARPRRRASLRLAEQ